MYHATQQAFGPYDKHLIYSEVSRHSIEVVPGYGAVQISCVLDGRETILSYDSPADLTADRWARGRILFPFPNRLAGGTYEWQGETYRFPLNDTPRRNALHGLGGGQEFTVTDQQLRETSAHLTLAYDYAGDRAYYPWPFRIEVTYALDDTAGLTVTLTARNTGAAAIPFGLGYHPYLSLGPKADDYHLALPPLEMIGVDDAMIPTGRRYAHDRYAGAGRKVGSDVLDNGFVPAAASGGEIALRLQGERGRLHYRQQLPPYGYLQLFTPPDRNALAVEPMTCNIDAFNNGDGLASLEPGEELRGEFGWRLEGEGPVGRDV